MTSNRDVPSRARRVVAVATFLITFGLAVVITAIAVATGRQPEDMVLALALSMFGAVGSLILVKRPANRVGPLLVVAGLVGVASGPGSMLRPETSAEVTALSGIETAVVLLGTAAFLLFVGLVLGVLPVVFPTGRALSHRWERALVVLIVVLSVQVLAVATAPEICLEDGPSSCAVNPFGLSFMPAWQVAFVPTLPVVGTGIAAGIVRFRRSSGAERLQMKWVVFALVLLVAEVAIVEVVTGTFGVELPGPFAGNANLMGSFVTLIPLAIGVSILRYRLYDIDRILKRTVSYTFIGAILGLGFAVIVLAPVAILGTSDGRSGDTWAIALATLVVFGLFDPVRRRVQGFVDRRFDRQRYDARLVLDGFGATLLNVTEATSIRREFGGAVGRMLRPTSVSIWLSDDRS
jgi:hypothetical protein